MLSHHFGGGVYAKGVAFSAGDILVQHKHNFDHLSILAHGQVELMVDGQKSVVTGPACLEIKAGKHHGVKALTAGAWYCIHATDCADPDEIDHTLVAPDSSQAEMTQIVQALKGA
jgi:quercetin dioxygenase-like cupin family protein